MSITVASMLLIVNGIWIQQTLRYASVQNARKETHQNLTRLGWQFRDDVHICNSIESLNDTKLKLIFDDNDSGTYTIKYESILLERFTNGSKTRSSSESYRLAHNAVAIFNSTELPDWISLRVIRGGEGERRGADFPQSAKELNERPTDLYLRVSPKRWASVKSQSSFQANSQLKASTTKNKRSVEKTANSLKSDLPPRPPKKTETKSDPTIELSTDSLTEPRQNLETDK
ncbi:MAG: hypothetical protein AB8B55_00690 [Mariniblastus sp.]